jgi:hypothetical protein
MGLRDFLGKPGAELETHEHEKRSTNFFSKIPPELQGAVEKIASKNHEFFEDRFPDLESFRQAVAECWLKQVEGFRTELETQGFTPIVPGTKASELNGAVLVFLTESGSFVIVGPGAFETDGDGAAIRYQKIPLRSTKQGTPEDVSYPDGFVFEATPRKGARIAPRPLELGKPPRVFPFAYTSPVIDSMMCPADKGSAAQIVERASAGVRRCFIRAQEEVGLTALPLPKK